MIDPGTERQRPRRPAPTPKRAIFTETPTVEAPLPPTEPITMDLLPPHEIADERAVDPPPSETRPLVESPILPSEPGALHGLELCLCWHSWFQHDHCFADLDGYGWDACLICDCSGFSPKE